MAIVVNTNIPALQAQRNLTNTGEALSKSIERLSSGFRINRASDDAAGMAIADRLKAQIRSYNQASRNTFDAISLVQVAEGAYNEVGNVMIRLRELAVQAATGTLSSTDRLSIQTEADRLLVEVTRIANTTQFSNVVLLNNTAALGNTIAFQVGIGTSASADQLQVNLYSLKATSFTSSGLDLVTVPSQGIFLTTASNAQASIANIDVALDSINSSRANLGAAQNALEALSRNQALTIENLSAAHSRIRDVDVAKETSELVRYQILMQAGTSVLSQANQLPSLALTLLQGATR
jgi:flagellin